MPVLPDPGGVPHACRLPAAGRYRVADEDLGMGRPARAGYPHVKPGAAPGLSVTDDVVADPVTRWRGLVDLYLETGLWPLLLASLGGDYDHRPWHSSELDPVSLARVDALDAAAVLAEGWADSLVPMGENPYVGHLHPYGAAFPGLTPRLPRGSAAAPVTMDALIPWIPRRLGLVPCRRPADAVAVIGWRGAINSRSAEQVSAVLRSWEDRFGVVLAELRFAALSLLVPHPPKNESQALPIAAELAALCPAVLSQDGPVDGFGYRSGGRIAGLARLLVGRPVWTLWWD